MELGGLVVIAKRSCIEQGLNILRAQMNIEKWDIVFQEVPGEISLAFIATGCPLKCKGCHSVELKTSTGTPLTQEKYSELITNYKGYVSCILFIGGEWCEKDLVLFLSIAKESGLNTCLYTGLTSVCEDIAQHLDYLKVGPWVERLGGLDSVTTNQRLYKIESDNTLSNITYKFWSKNDKIVQATN